MAILISAVALHQHFPSTARPSDIIDQGVGYYSSNRPLKNSDVAALAPKPGAFSGFLIDLGRT